MIGYRHIVGIVIASFVMSFIFLGSGVLLQLSGSHSSNNFIMLSLPFNYIGVLAAWLSRLVKQQSDRLDRIEAQMRERTSA